MKKKIFGIFVCMLLIGTFFTVSGNDNYNKIANKENNQVIQMSTLNNLGHLYKDWGRPDDALDYYYKALARAESFGNKTYLTFVLRSIAENRV